MNADGLAIVIWLPSAESEENQVPGSEFFVDYAEIGKTFSHNTATPGFLVRKLGSLMVELLISLQLCNSHLLF